MKWARVIEKNNPNPKNKDAEQDRKNDDACYNFYPSQKALEKEMEQDKLEWAKYEFKFHFRNEKNAYENFQKRYEIFCGGYLLFYDNIVRSKAVDHILHFKWSPEKGTGKYSVQIYLTPPAQKPLTGKPPGDKNSKDNSPNGRPDGPAGSSSSPVSKAFQDMTTAGGANTGDSFSVDPPPPPPPPPPSVH